MNDALIKKRCVICGAIKSLAEFAMEPLALSSLRKIEKYGDICLSCRERLKIKSNLELDQPKKQFIGKRLRSKDDDRGEGGRGKGSRLTIDANSRLFEIKKSQLKLAAEQQASRDLTTKRNQMKSRR